MGQVGRQPQRSARSHEGHQRMVASDRCARVCRARVSHARVSHARGGPGRQRVVSGKRKRALPVPERAGHQRVVSGDHHPWLSGFGGP
jgi:hypothetical protein